MPLEYHINPDDGLITVHGAGEVTLDDIKHLGETLIADDAYDPALPQLLDFRGLRPADQAPGQSEREAAELLDFVQAEYRGNVTGNVAVVIDDHLESRHCADIFLVTCAIQNAELFADYDQAIKWLMRQAFANGSARVAGGSAQQQHTGKDHADSAPE